MDDKKDTMKIIINGIVYEVDKRVEGIWIEPEAWDEDSR